MQNPSQLIVKDYYEKINYSTPLDKIIEIAKSDKYLDYYDIDLKPGSLNIFKLPPVDKLKKQGIEFHWWGYYNKWVPQENYYYAVKHAGFEANPDGRMEGTYSKYAQIDDATDALLYYMMFIKYGIGRATSDASHEVRDGHINREEAVSLVHRFDGEFPERDLNELMQYLDMSINDFNSLCDKFRSPHLWEKLNNTWNLKHKVS